jgi:RND family efflux transporter MFP subunit
MKNLHLLPLALTLAAVSAGCGGGHHESANAGAGPAVTVSVLHPASGAGDALVLPARVTAREEVTLTARLAARLTSLPLREGDRFRAGQVLASFDAPETRATLDGAKAGLAAALAARDLARKQEARMDSLHAQRVAALRELEGAQAERRAAEAAWAQARAQVDGLQSGTHLTAPFAGIVVRRHADPGTTVGPGQPLLDIRSVEVGDITANVPESELARLAGGMADYQVGDGPWRSARVSRVDGMTDFGTRSRVARLRPAGGEKLEAGAFARVRLAPRAASATVASTAASLSVPVASLVRRGGLTGVFVAENGVARLRWLRVGRESGESVEVLAGLGPADAVIVNPAGLADGRSVTVAGAQEQAVKDAKVAS